MVLQDEEDEYDKVAIGSEQNSDRLYMKDVKSTDDQVNELNTYGEYPKTVSLIYHVAKRVHFTMSYEVSVCNANFY